MKRNTKDGYKIINKGTDARGNNYWLVYDPVTGGSKYIWDKGHVWAGFKGSQLKQSRVYKGSQPPFSTRVKKPLYRPLLLVYYEQNENRRKPKKDDRQHLDHGPTIEGNP